MAVRPALSLAGGGRAAASSPPGLSGVEAALFFF